MSGRFLRLAETDRPRITIVIDGQPVEALAGDTLMVAMLTSGAHLRVSEFGPEKRAGFCLMGACQDCWVWCAEGGRLRACSTAAANGMQVSTRQPEVIWPSPV
jgi:predicted molibdopterin-dependent oxidoreductase YjgC